jgi:hypothetical protein
MIDVAREEALKWWKRALTRGFVSWMRKKHNHRFQKADKRAAKSPDSTWDPGKNNYVWAGSSKGRDGVCSKANILVNASRSSKLDAMFSTVDCGAHGGSGQEKCIQGVEKIFVQRFLCPE